MLTFHETYDHWSVAVFTVTVHFISTFFQIGCFRTEFNLLNLFLIAVYDNGSTIVSRGPDFDHFWVINFTKVKCRVCSSLLTYHEFLTKEKDSLAKNRNRDLRKHFVAGNMLNKRSIDVFMNSSKKYRFLKSLLNQSFLRCPVISVYSLIA